MGKIQPNWQIAGSGDFNLDGRVDFIFQNPISNHWGIYLMNGTSPSKWVSLGLFSKDWEIRN
jgi:hypothetical protein